MAKLHMGICNTLLLVASLMLSSVRLAAAQPATILTVSGSPAPMTISGALPGNQPTAVTDATTTYFVRVKNPSGTGAISARLDAPMPLGTTLKLTLTPSSGATSVGPVTLSTISQAVVTNIKKENGSNLRVTYVFEATAAAGVVPAQSRAVTLTLVALP
jgi:hypothetical protein